MSVALDPALAIEAAESFSLFGPFIEFGFMRRALVGCLALSLGATPIGAFLMLRRMSLAGDAMSHAVLPGAALAYLVFGLSLSAMTVGGLIAGITVALLAGGVARHSVLKEDASLAAFYLISLSAGVLIVSLRGSSVDLLHVLFGSVLALDDNSLYLLAGFCTVTLMALAAGFRLLVIDCCEPGFLRGISRWSPVTHYGFLVLVVLNLVGGFHALGTLMAVGIMILPAAAARFWVDSIGRLLLIAVGCAFAGSFIGLLLSYHFELPAGPSIVMTLGGFYLISLAAGPHGPLRARFARPWHYET